MSGNPFNVFELAPSFTLDLAALEKKYFSLQRQFHPDRLIGKSDSERQKAIHASMEANEAYEVLKSPLKRGQALLALQNITVGSESDSVKPSHMLLVEIMELRETLEDASTVQQLEAFERRHKQHQGTLLQELAQSFANKNYEQAAQQTIRLGYMNKIADEIRVKKKGVAA